MRPKKIPVKVLLTPETIHAFRDIAPDKAIARVGADILEAAKNWKGDLISLLHHIAHGFDKKD